MDHSSHEPGTMTECPECRALAYEPGWYKALREERVVSPDRGRIRIPDADERDPDIVVAESPPEPAEVSEAE
jgi:hypothetical protein